jgi:antitoxin YefM
MRTAKISVAATMAGRPAGVTKSDERRRVGQHATSGGTARTWCSRHLVTFIQVMTVIPLADAKARLSAVLDEVRDTHDRVVITRNGRPEAVIMSVSDLEVLEETLDLLSTPAALDEIRVAEAEIARGEAIGAEELQRQMEQRTRAEQSGE